MKRREQRLALGVLMCLMAVFLGLYSQTRPEAVQGSKTVTVEVVHSDGTTKVMTYHTDEEYLGDVLLEEGLAEGEQGPYGLYIQSVDGEEASYERDKAYWSLYEGEDYATQGADQTVIEDGDCFRLEYTRG